MHEYGRQEDMMFCGIFDGHGPWGHFVSKLVRDSLPLSLLYNWQDAIVEVVVDLDLDFETEKMLQRFSLLEQSYFKACAYVNQELEQHRKIDSFYSGTTSLTVVRQEMRLGLESDSEWNFGHDYAGEDMLEPRETDILALFLFLVVFPLVAYYYLLGRWSEVLKKKETSGLLTECDAA